MGLLSYPDEERTIHHRQSRDSPTVKFLRFICQVMLFFMCLAVVGGIIMGVIALHNSTAVNGPDHEISQTRILFARSYYGNVTASGNTIPTGTAPASMNNGTIVVNITTGDVPSGPTPSVTFTIGAVGAVEASTEVGQVTDVPSPSGGSSTPAFFSKPADDCILTTVTLTATKTIVGTLSGQVNSTSKAMAPFTTIVIPDLYSKATNGQLTLSSQVVNVTSTAVIQEATETAATGINLTTTLTVFKQPTVIVTSTALVYEDMSSFPEIPAGQSDTGNSHCMSKAVITASASSDKALNGTALEIITVQPANQPGPETTQTASSNGTSPVIVSESAPLKHSKRAGSILSGCLMTVVATLLCML